MAIGPTAINLVGRILEIKNLRPIPQPKDLLKQEFKFYVDTENRVITLPYNPSSPRSDDIKGPFHTEILKSVLSLKYRVAKNGAN